MLQAIRLTDHGKNLKVTPLSAKKMLVSMAPGMEILSKVLAINCTTFFIHTFLTVVWVQDAPRSSKRNSFQESRRLSTSCRWTSKAFVFYIRRIVEPGRKFQSLIH